MFCCCRKHLFHHPLMTDESSPMLDFIGRQKEWEAIVLIPFINEVDTYTHTYTFNFNTEI